MRVGGQEAYVRVKGPFSDRVVTMLVKIEMEKGRVRLTLVVFILIRGNEIPNLLIKT